MARVKDSCLFIWSLLMVSRPIIGAEGDTVLAGYLMRGGVNPPQCVTPETTLLEVASTNEADLLDCALFMLREHAETDKFVLIDLSVVPPFNQMTLVGSSWEYTDTGSGIWFADPEDHYLPITGVTSSNTGPLTDQSNPVQMKFSDIIAYPVFVSFVHASCNVAYCLNCADSDQYYCETCPDDHTPNTDHSYCIACSTISYCERCVSDVNGDYTADNCTRCADDYLLDNATCSLIDCGTPADIDHGSVTYDSTEIHGNASYTCEEGYELIGEGNVTCENTTQWSSTPSCLFVDCSFPTAPDNGSVTYTRTTYGATIMYNCITGMAIEGQTSATCQANGHWSGSVPICKVINCGNLTAPNNGAVDFNSTLYLANALFTCDQDYILVGSALATCSDSGQWENIPFCQATATSTTTITTTKITTIGPNNGGQGNTEGPNSDSQLGSGNAKVTAGVIGGIVVGVVLVIGAALVIVIICKVKKSKETSSVTDREGMPAAASTTASSALTYGGQAIAPLKPRGRQGAWFAEGGEEKLHPDKIRETFGPPQQPQAFAGQNSTASGGLYENSHPIEMDQYNLPHSPPPAYQSHNFATPKSSLVKKK